MPSLRSCAFAAATAVASLAWSAASHAETVTLTLHHFLSPKSSTHEKFLKPWAERVEKQSNGALKIEIFPSMSMGGKPPELYRQVRDGAADMIWTVTGYTPGVFPRVEVFELPGVHGGSAEATTRAIQNRFDLIADDFRAIKPLLVHVHAGNALHLRNGCVESVADLRGLKFRTPTRTGGWMISSWGAEPVGMPVPALPQALAKGVIDGALIPFEIVPPLKVQDLTTCSVTLNDNLRFGTAVFLFAMNGERYAGLAPKLRAVLDANSGTNLAPEIGALWDRSEVLGTGVQAATGSPINALSVDVGDDLAGRHRTVVDRWIKDVTPKGIDGAALVDAARTAIKDATDALAK